jgi:toxin ParE1/3/4
VQVIFTPLAARQVESLHEYISTHSSEKRADDYVGRIVTFCQRLTAFPLRGTRRDDLLPGLRVIGFERRASIVFVVTDSAILVEGIFYAGREFEAIFRARK